MTKMEYLKYAINKQYLKDLTWYYTFMVMLTSVNYKNKFITIVNNEIKVLVNDEYIMIEGFTKSEALFSITDNIMLPKGIINNNTDVTTTVGLMILNYILLYDALGKHFVYVNGEFNISKIEAKIGELLNNDIISVDDYKRFSNNAIFLEKFSRIVTISATIKNITPPDGLKAFKDTTIKKFETTYGKNWYTDPTRVVEFENELKGYYNEYVSDDPSDGVFLSGKIKNNAGLKKYLTFGLAMGMQAQGEDIKHIEGSLLDGYPKDKEKLAAMFDTARYASYNRGSETQKGGAAAKVMLRATSSIVITQKDCGVKYGKKIQVTKDIANALVSRYMLVNGKIKILATIDEVNSYIGKTIELRSPQYCTSKDTSFCRVCAGEQMAKYEKGASLVLTDISNILLYISMAKMHNTSISGMATNPIDGIV